MNFKLSKFWEKNLVFFVRNKESNGCSDISGLAMVKA